LREKTLQSAKSCDIVNGIFNSRGEDMSRMCELCGKGKMRGNTVSHSNRKAPRHYKPNLQKESFEIDGNNLSVTVCTKCKKTLTKKD